MPADVIPRILAAVAAAPDSDTALAAAITAAPYLREPNSTFTEAYRAARAGKFDSFADVIAPHLLPGDVVDVGAGDIQLLTRLKQATGLPGIYLATDVTGPAAEQGDVRLVVQDSPDRLPVADDQTATVIATGMLHHVPRSARTALLAEMHRCLAPEGRIILIEDTFPGESWEPVDPIDESFEALSHQQRIHYLAWTDWWGNRVLKNRPSEPLPCTFQTLPQWGATLTGAGFERVHERYLGVWDAGGHMATPRALMVWRKCR